MTRIAPEMLDYYNYEVIQMIMAKYGMSEMDAARSFLTSETHAMLEDQDLGLTEFGAGALFDMWENEKITGNPRTSIYIRAE